MAGERAGQFEIGAGRGIDFHMRVEPHPRRQAQSRAGAALGALDIEKCQGRGRDLGARKSAEAVERAEAEIILKPARRRGGIVERAADRRERNAQVGHQPRKITIVAERVWRDDLGRIDTGDFRAERGGLDLRDRKSAGRNIDAGQTEHSLLALRKSHDGEQAIGPRRFQQAFLGDRAGRDEADHVAADDGLAAALPGFGRVFDLLANRDAVAERDEA